MENATQPRNTHLVRQMTLVATNMPRRLGKRSSCACIQYHSRNNLQESWGRDDRKRLQDNSRLRPVYHSMYIVHPAASKIEEENRPRQSGGALGFAWLQRRSYWGWGISPMGTVVVNHALLPVMLDPGGYAVQQADGCCRR